MARAGHPYTFGPESGKVFPEGFLKGLPGKGKCHERQSGKTKRMEDVYSDPDAGF
jgi:hypothetical protein